MPDWALGYLCPGLRWMDVVLVLVWSVGPPSKALSCIATPQSCLKWHQVFEDKGERERFFPSMLDDEFCEECRPFAWSVSGEKIRLMYSTLLLLLLVGNWKFFFPPPLFLLPISPGCLLICSSSAYGQLNLTRRPRGLY